MIGLPRPVAIYEQAISSDAAARLRAWFKALYAGNATPSQVIHAMGGEIILG